MNKAAWTAALLPLLLLTASAQILPPDFFPPFPPPRVDLSDTNAAPMQVQEMSVAAAVRGLYATVDTTLTVRNPNARLLEGDLVFPLPDGAAVCGYALDINGVLTDGVVVKKEKARVAFETETRRRVDPGLVEHVKGNLYRTRIYPLPANGTRTIRLSYTTPLSLAPSGDAALLLPMPRQTIEKLSVKIEVANEAAEAPVLGGLGDLRFQQAENFWRVESTTTNSAPTSDVWVALPKLPANLSAVEKSDDGSVWFSVSTIAPLIENSKPPVMPSQFHILWDASGSRAGADLQKEYNLISALPPNATYELVVFRDVPEPAREFKTAADLVAALKEVPCDGGSDFAALAPAVPHTGAPVVLFTDGLDTLSDQPLEFTGAKPIAIVSQTVADREALRQACAGALIDLQTADMETALREILQPAPRITGLNGTGIANVQGLGRPATGRVRLLGQLTAPEATVRIEYAGGMLSEPFTLRAAEAREGRTLATAWAAARVSQLAPRADPFEDDLLALGRKFGLVSPATSLIVLESLDQWVRHEIEPPASLPEMRAQYFAAMKSRSRDEGDARTRHLEQLAELWKQRVEWWQRDYRKNPLAAAAPKEAPMTPGTQSAVETEPRQTIDYAESGHPLYAMAGAAELAAPAFLPAAPLAREQDANQAAASAPPAAAIAIKPWSPDVPYLKSIRSAPAETRYAAYLAERGEWAQSPAFFLDCAEEFLKQDDRPLGLRILSNLAELRIEDAALLRVFAWRLRQAGDLDRAVVLLRRVARLRAEEPQSFRDLALALAERGQAARNRADLEEALNLYQKVACTPWNRHADSIPIFALEEFNALAAWIDRQSWPDGARPAIPELARKFRRNLDTDIRIMLAWDADATDIDLHVVEPGGEEAFYSHNRTTRGGLVSRDITDGYGPEEYLIRAAPGGTYAIQAKYYGSRQQTVVGAATVTATVFTDWGRPGEQRQTLALRLDQPHDLVDIGAITFGAAGATARTAPGDFARLQPGLSKKAVERAVGPPAKRQKFVWRYEFAARLVAVHFDNQGRLLRVVEILPGGIENIVVQ